jgi:hypothetical protein
MLATLLLGGNGPRSTIWLRRGTGRVDAATLGYVPTGTPVCLEQMFHCCDAVD